ncbi:hypothetical protein CRE_20889 [Caenorhabditis remanei]|uniref:Uncharacterized protein n=1 Tax=Caenorhabditis remanei TaxID=31234 RepID=E3MV49_CAERE|nr:hypothetical protein CRE_20889 [Caenorhabditis remanei]
MEKNKLSLLFVLSRVCFVFGQLLIFSLISRVYFIDISVSTLNQTIRLELTMEPPPKKPKQDSQKSSRSHTSLLTAEVTVPTLSTFRPPSINPSNATTASLVSRLNKQDQKIKKLQENGRLKTKKYEEREDLYLDLLQARNLRIKELEKQLKDYIGDGKKKNGAANSDAPEKLDSNKTDKGKGGAMKAMQEAEQTGIAAEKFVEDGNHGNPDEMDDEREEGEFSDESDDEREQHVEKVNQRKMNSLTRMRDPYKTVHRSIWIMGIAIEKCLVTKIGENGVKRTGPGTRLYSKFLGIIEGLDDKNEETMQVGEVYKFQVQDKRSYEQNKDKRLTHLIAVSPADWHLFVSDGVKSMDRDAFQITTTFHLADIKKVNDVYFFLDNILTKVKIHEDDAEKLKNYKENNPSEKIRITAAVKTYQNYMEAYRKDSTRIIFVMTRILKVEKCKTREILFQDNYRVVN